MISLRFLGGLSPALRVAVVFYLLHILLQGKIALLQITAFVTILFLGWSIARGEMRASFHILFFPLALYGLASSLSALANGVSIHRFADAGIWFKMLIFPAALLIFRQVPQTRELALRAQIVFATSIALVGLYQYFALDRRDLEHRITGTSTHVMTYSGLLLPASLLLLVLAIHRQRWWLWAAAGITSFALLLTFTRSVWVAWAVAALALFALTRPRWLMFAVPLLLIFVTLMPLDLFGRLISSFDLEVTSNFDRVRMVEAGAEIIKDYPTTGVGPANVKEIYPLYRKPDAPRFRPPHLHNNVVQIWAERGILGLSAYLLLLGLFLRECARGWRGGGRMWAEGGVVVAVGLTCAGLFEFNFGDAEVFYLMLEYFALIVASLEATPEPAPNEPAPSLVPAGS
ncbi:MAG TPA: O-antigen ligase family protein [Thermoanaerobaculia bacterium]|nr:O-antigen ligase family protein [Thermoanaerobaculia bacterium]